MVAGKDDATKKKKQPRRKRKRARTTAAPANRPYNVTIDVDIPTVVTKLYNRLKHFSDY